MPFPTHLTNQKYCLKYFLTIKMVGQLSLKKSKNLVPAVVLKFDVSKNLQRFYKKSTL